MTPKNAKNTTTDEGPSLFKQLMGAVIGGSLALGLYYAYDYGAPTVTAWLSIPQEQFSVWKGTASQKDLKPEETRRLSARTRNMVNIFGQKNAAGDEEVMEEADIVENAAETEETTEGGDFWKDAWEDDEGVEDDDGWEVEENANRKSQIANEKDDLDNSWEDTWEAPVWKDEAIDSVVDTMHAEALPDSGPGVLSLVVTTGAFVGWRKAKRKV